MEKASNTHGKDLPAALISAAALMEQLHINEGEMQRMIEEGRIPRPIDFEGQKCFVRGYVVGEGDTLQYVERATFDPARNEKQ